MALRDLEEELYKKEFNPVTRGASHAVEEAPPPPVPSAWEHHEESGAPRPSRRPRLFLIGSILAGLGVVSVAAVFLIAANRDVGAVDVRIESPDRLYRGVPFTLVVQVSNQRETPVHQTAVTLKLPPGVVALEGPKNAAGQPSDSIGSLGAGSINQKSFSLVAVGDTRSVQRVEASVSYVVGERTKLDAQASRDLAIQENAISMEIGKVEKTPRGSPVTVTVRYKNTSGFDFKDVVVRARYPQGFTFASSTRRPDETTGTWHLGGLPAGADEVLAFTGTIEGPDDARLGIPVTISASLGGVEYMLIEQSVTLVVAPSPITITITANGSPEAVVRPGGQLVYSIYYKNTSGIALADVILRARFESDLFDLGTVATDGQWNSLEHIVLWNASNDARLRLLDPGVGGSVGLAIRLKQDVGAYTAKDKDRTVRIVVEADSPSVPFYLSGSHTNASISLATKIAGALSFDAWALYRDPSAKVANQGPFPPRVNQATEYTVRWTVANTTTDMSKLKVRAVLAQGVAMTGVVTGSVETLPTWNPRTQEIMWALDKVPAGSGIYLPIVEVVFQVRAVPNAAQIGQFMPLIGEARLEAVDNFTGEPVELRAGMLTTQLISDTTVGPNDGRVLP